jgi:hypothetical protein
MARIERLQRGDNIVHPGEAIVAALLQRTHHDRVDVRPDLRAPRAR